MSFTAPNRVATIGGTSGPACSRIGEPSNRRIESVLSEIKELDKKGVKEINIIGQDITAYGMDIYREKSLARLLKEIIPVTKNIQWIRLLYAFPAHTTDELIDTIASEEKICKYIDMPMQHISDRILRDMNRSSAVPSFWRPRGGSLSEGN